jgi:hypothetical protein
MKKYTLQARLAFCHSTDVTYQSRRPASGKLDGRTCRVLSFKQIGDGTAHKQGFSRVRQASSLKKKPTTSAGPLVTVANAATLFQQPAGRVAMFQSQRLFSYLLVASAVTFASSTGAIDLISHNGFSECWDQSISKDQFLEAARSSVDGITACVPPQSGNSPAPFSFCDTNACAGGQQGCPMTLHASTAPAGDFATGSFSGTGSLNDITVQLAVFQVPCTLTITGITLAYGWTNTLQPDGNNGQYAGALPGASATFNTYSLGGNCQGSVNSLFGATAAVAAQSAVANAIKPRLTTATVPESVCPLQ